jgi:hypothetical protein
MKYLASVLTTRSGALLAELNFEALEARAFYLHANAGAVVGPPTSGTWELDELYTDSYGSVWRCSAAGTTGSWIQIAPAVAAANPTGTIPTGYEVVRTDRGRLRYRYTGSTWICIALDETATVTGTWTFTVPFALGGTASGALVSGLNADQLDGLHASALALSGHNHDSAYSALGHTHGQSGITDWPLTCARGGSGANNTPTSGQFLRGNGSAFVAAALALGDLPSGIDADKVATYHAAQAATASTVAVRDAAGCLTIAAPTATTHATTRQWVQDYVSGFSIAWTECVCATTGNVNTASAPATNNAVWDGRTVATNDRILLRAQTTGTQNGIWIYNGSGSAMTRATDADQQSEIVKGKTVFVRYGTLYGGSRWQLLANGSGNDPVLNTDTLTFTQIDGSNPYTAGPGVGMNGNELYVKLGSAGSPAGYAYTQGALVYADAAGSLNMLADVASGSVLMSAGTTSVPTWGQVGLTTHVSGTLPVANGGTGATTLAGILQGNGSSAVTALTGTAGRHALWAASAPYLGASIVGESGQVLTLNGGASTIQTASGDLTLATAAGNAHIRLTPNGVGTIIGGNSQWNGKLALNTSPFGSDATILVGGEGTYTGGWTTGMLFAQSYTSANATSGVAIVNAWFALSGSATVPRISAVLANGGALNTAGLTEYVAFDSNQWTSGVNNYGLRVRGVAAATAWGVYVDYAQSYFGGNATCAADVIMTGGNLAIRNGGVFMAKNSSGVYETFFWPRHTDNGTYVNYGAAGLYVRNNSASLALYCASDTRIGVCRVGPTALLHLASGSATAGFAPLKFTTGTLLGTIEQGAVEWDGTRLYYTDGAARRTIAHTAEFTTDHGSLGGLGDDDHTQYHTDSRGDARYPRKDGTGATGTWPIHITGVSQETKLLGVWDGTTCGFGYNTLASTGSRTADLAPNTYGQQISWEFKQCSFSGGTGRYAGLLTLAPWTGTTASTGDSTYQLLFSGLSPDATTAPVIRARSGIDTTWGSWVTLLHTANRNDYTYPAAAHVHAASDITSGVIAPARLASGGPPNSGSWLRGDGAWSSMDWTFIGNKPTVFPPDSHGHAASEISGVLPISKGGTNATAFGMAMNSAIVFYNGTSLASSSSLEWDGLYIHAPYGLIAGSIYYTHNGIAALSGTSIAIGSGAALRLNGDSLSFFDVSPVGRRSAPASATDLASAITAVNSIKASLQAYGLLN